MIFVFSLDVESDRKHWSVEATTFWTVESKSEHAFQQQWQCPEVVSTVCNSTANTGKVERKRQDTIQSV